MILSYPPAPLLEGEGNGVGVGGEGRREMYMLEKKRWRNEEHALAITPHLRDYTKIVCNVIQVVISNDIITIPISSSFSLASLENFSFWALTHSAWSQVFIQTALSKNCAHISRELICHRCMQWNVSSCPWVWWCRRQPLDTPFSSFSSLSLELSCSCSDDIQLNLVWLECLPVMLKCTHLCVHFCKGLQHLVSSL